ncbi:MAG: glycosyltransferase [Candidatus Saccharibacteria bacterium]|nr:glycosyltransferase [Candidatus Saccharibacteria bacterium]
MTKRKLRVGLISSYVPMKCGIATHSRDLLEAMLGHSNFDWRLVAAEDTLGPYNFNDKEIATLDKSNKKSYEAAAEAMNKWQPDVVLLAHEFGLYGGTTKDIQHNDKNLHVITGDYILTLIDKLKAPIITTLHTIIPDPDKLRREVMRAISKRSSKLVSMTDDGRSTLDFFYGIKPAKVAVIPHGVPQPVQRDKKLVLKDLKLDTNKFYLLVTGLIGPNKGIELIIKALPDIIKKHSEVMLLVVGQTHPVILEEVGEVYREGLIKLATELGVCDHIQFVNEYLPTDKLVDYLTIADVYLTIHSDPEQAASGTLAYALGCGLASISTPYRYAKEVLADGRGFLVPFNDPLAIAKQVDTLIENKALLNETREKAMLFGCPMSWEKVGDEYMKLVEAILQE